MSIAKFLKLISSGQAAIITPRHVTSGLGARKVKAIAAAKHHTVITTEGGEVFTWGSNRGKKLYSVTFLPHPLFSNFLYR